MQCLGVSACALARMRACVRAYACERACVCVCWGVCWRVCLHVCPPLFIPLSVFEDLKKTRYGPMNTWTNEYMDLGMDGPTDGQTNR